MSFQWEDTIQAVQLQTTDVSKNFQGQAYSQAGDTVLALGSERPAGGGE
jgi:hypothetical protein